MHYRDYPIIFSLSIAIKSFLAVTLGKVQISLTNEFKYEDKVIHIHMHRMQS